VAVRLSRYDRSRFVDYSDLIKDYDILQSDFVDSLKRLQSLGFVSITEPDENRLDIISFRLYGDTTMWWILAEFNGLLNPFELEVGSKIFYPSLGDIETIYFNIQKSLNTFPDGR